MVRIATSIAAVTLLAGTALAQGYYDEQFERSLTDNDNLEARSEAVLGDYLAAREELEEQYGREITHNERRELFEALEERDPELFSLFGREPLNFGGAKEAGKFVMHHVGHHHGHHRGHAAEAVPEQQQDPTQRNQRRDFEELEQREPVNIAAFKGITERVIRLAKKKHAEQQAGGGQRPTHLGHRFGHGGNFGPTQQQPENPYQGRSYDEDLSVREFEDYLEARGLRHWLKGKLSGNRSQTQPTDTGSDTLAARAYDDYVEARHVNLLHYINMRHSEAQQQQQQQQQQSPRSFDDSPEELEMRDIAEELVARAPGLVRWVKNKLHRKQGAADESQQQQYQPQQQYKRSFDDAEELDAREPGVVSWTRSKFHRKQDDMPQQQQYQREFFDAEELDAREPGVVSWARSKFHRKQSVDESQQQQYQRSFDDAEELDARDPGVVSWARSKFHRKQSADESQQQYQREFFDDAEELEMREFDEDFEDMLARDYDYFDELD